MGELVNLAPRLVHRAVGNGRWVSKQELAAHLGISTRTIDRWVESGMPEDAFGHPGAWRYIGSRRRFMLDAVLLWLENVA